MGNKRTYTDVKVTDFHSEPCVAVGTFFKGFKAPKDTTFDIYKEKKSSDKFILHGENDRLEYEGKTDEDFAETSQYVVGVYDAASKSVELYKAPVLSTKVVSKASKNLIGPEIKQSNIRAAVLRTALGEAFGTKKAKKAIADMERNRIDSDKLVDSAIDIVDSVKTASKELPTKEELLETVSADRPTPQANLEATDVEQVYPLHNIIPKKEWSFIRVSSIMKEEDPEKRLEYFPYNKFPYIAKKLPTITQASQMQKLQLLYYLSLLVGVYDNRRVNSKEKLLERINSPPDALLDGVLERFTISRPGQFGRSKEKSYFIDPQREDKLLCYILTIILHLDNFIVEVPPLAQQLNLKPSKLVALFKILGATVKGATVAQAEAFGLPKSSASTYKIASLKVPFKLPEMTRRGRASGR